MELKQKVVEIAKNDPRILQEIISHFCPKQFGISNSFVAVNRYGCSRCDICWNRTEEVAKRDEEIWQDYKKTDFKKVDFDTWLKSWNIE
jgi:hypothetical protein